MLGHVAQSIGTALPGGQSPIGCLGQSLILPKAGAGAGSLTYSVTAPKDTLFAFIEALGRGAASSGSGNLQGAGGAGGDAILETQEGDVFDIAFTAHAVAANATTIRRSTTLLLSASDAVGVTGASGKYPGANGFNNVRSGIGGGRLAGNFGVADGGPIYPAGPGAGGVASNNGSAYPALGAACLTFFRTQDAALAFANALYGGNWQP